MKNISIRTAFLMVSWILAAGAEAADPSLLVKGTDANFKEQVLGSKVPVLVDFWAPWCGPCRYYEPMVERAAKRHKGKLRVVKVNFDENSGLVRNYSVQGIPLTLLFRDGELVQKFVGAPRSEKAFQSIVDEFVKGGPKEGPSPSKRGTNITPTSVSKRSGSKETPVPTGKGTKSPTVPPGGE
jgi:thioredoxin 1